MKVNLISGVSGQPNPKGHLTNWVWSIPAGKDSGTRLPAHSPYIACGFPTGEKIPIKTNEWDLGGLADSARVWLFVKHPLRSVPSIRAEFSVLRLVKGWHHPAYMGVTPRGAEDAGACVEGKGWLALAVGPR